MKRGRRTRVSEVFPRTSPRLNLCPNQGSTDFTYELFLGGSSAAEHKKLLLEQQCFRIEFICDMHIISQKTLFWCNTLMPIIQSSLNCLSWAVSIPSWMIFISTAETRFAANRAFSTISTLIPTFIAREFPRSCC